ncbi:TPA: hypothetical protein TZW92_002129 [Streptococcus suis]|nr:hypothetical protein [Streptococcus suis]
MPLQTKKQLNKRDIDRASEALLMAGGYAEVLARQNPQSQGTADKMKAQLSRVYEPLVELASRSVGMNYASEMMARYIGPEVAFSVYGDMLDDGETPESDDE